MSDKKNQVSLSRASLTEKQLQDLADTILFEDLPLDNNFLTDEEDEDDDNIEDYFENIISHVIFHALIEMSHQHHLLITLGSSKPSSHVQHLQEMKNWEN
jgi:hypothetical protein